MRKTYLTLSGILFIAGLIVCFENIMVPAAGFMIFFTSVSGSSIFVPAMFLFMLGISCGFFAGLWLKSKEPKNEIEGGGFDYDI